MAEKNEGAVIVVGAGQAGYQCCEALREAGFAGPVTLIGAESHPPYQRPPLSKDYLLGKSGRESLLYRPPSWYEEKNIGLRLGEKVAAIDPARKLARLASGEELAYWRLVLATGARVRRLDVEGAELKGVCYLRTLDHVDEIARRMKTAREVVIVGAGFIGLEFAAVARLLGKNVTVLEAASRVMERVARPELSQYLQELHEGHGVKIICNAAARAIGGRGSKGSKAGRDGRGEQGGGEGDRVGSVMLADGREIRADLVLVGIGVAPNMELALEAGLECGNGVLVDANARTSDENIFAAGDCALYAHPFIGEPVRLESVQNAGDQARAAAGAIAGKPRPYEAIPWFWSDQYDVKLQMAGLAISCDSHVIRGEPETGRFSIWHFKSEKLRAVEAVNMPLDYMAGRRLLEAGISPSIGQARDSSFRLKRLLT
jgi:3-phenylpropionate/trans-cinnamate dioxygenase ferredoxin reductase subunit